MSETVAKAIRLTGGDEAKETAKFIEMVDRLFDCMNVSSLSRGKLLRKPFVQPYRNAKDFRIAVSGILVIVFKYNSLIHSFFVVSCYLTLRLGR